MHSENRDTQLEPGTHYGRTSRRGFTVLELGIAVFIFSLIAGVATLAIARAQLAASVSRLQRATSTELDNMLAVVATGPYNDIVDGVFLRPEACPQAAHMSCVEVLGRELTVLWSIDGLADPAEISTRNPAGILMTVRADLPGGEVVERSRQVNGANWGRDGTGLIRVRLSGATYDGPLYVITSSGEVAGSAVARGTSTTVRVDAADCTNENPCRLGLLANGATNNANVSLDHQAVSGDGIVIEEGATVETAVNLRTPSELQIMLLAENADGRRGWADANGSVCLYLRIPVGSETVEEPACNSEAADRIVWRTYKPNPEEPWEIYLPTNVDIVVATDPVDAPCQADGQRGWSGTTWETASVCTGWTWGAFDELRNGITGTESVAVENIVRVIGGAITYKSAVWTAAGNSSPAAGYEGGVIWGKPRDIPACSGTSSCTTTAGDPESGCPLAYCNSSGNTAPVLTGPIAGAYAVYGSTLPAGDETTITLGFADAENDTITLTLTETPASMLKLCAGGSSCIGEPYLSSGDTLAVSGNGSVPLTVFTGSGFTNETLTLTLTDGNSSRQVMFYLREPGSERTLVELRGAPIRMYQNDNITLRVIAYGNDGEGMEFLTTTSGGPELVSFGNPVAGSVGWFSVPVTAGAVNAGADVYTLTSGETSGGGSITILGTPALITLDSLTVTQGGSEIVNSTLTDAAGEPLAGADIWFKLTAGSAGTVPLGTYPQVGGCVTDSGGSCSITVLSELSAITGSFTIEAHSDQASAAAGLNVESGIASITSDGDDIEQGESAVITLTAYDGRNEPASGVAWTATTTAVGVNVTSSGVTLPDGSGTLTVATSTITPIGSVVVTLSDGTNNHTIKVNVTSTVAEIVTAESSLTIGRLGNIALPVTLKNPQGVTVPYTQITVTAGEGVYVPSVVTSNLEGSAIVPLSIAPDADLGSASITLSYNGSALATVNLTIRVAVASVTIEGDIAADTANTVSVMLLDPENMPIGGRVVSISAADTRITISPSAATTNLLGRATLTLTTGALPRGTYTVNVLVDGRNIPVGVIVS